MLIIGCDYHPGFEQIALVDTETGEVGERRLIHREEAEQFYRTLAAIHDPGDILGDGQITAPQFFQGANPVLSAVHGMELVAA